MAMKALRITIIVLIFTVLLSGFQPVRAQAYPRITAQTAIVIDAKSGKEIFAKNAGTIMYPASTTKIMTALLAVEHGDLDEIVTIGNEVNEIAWDSSRANLRPGDTLSLRDLLYGMMLASGNDAAYATAVHIARIHSEEPSMPIKTALHSFADMMNQRAKDLGAENTNFVNPDGYPHNNHYTTARDLALITVEAMQNPEYREFDSTAQHTPETWRGGNIQSWTNGNHLIRTQSSYFYDKAIGGKTGYTNPARFTMVATAAHDDAELVAVALKTDANGRWTDTTAMLQYGFENYPIQPSKPQNLVTIASMILNYFIVQEK